jgi:hypothetical protein
MAIGKGKASVEGASFKRYIGVASMSIVGVNPTKAELEKIQGRTIENDPVYSFERENADGTKTKGTRVTIYLKANPDKYVDETLNPINLIVPVTFSITDTPTKGSTSGKYKVLDEFARTAWATPEDIQNNTIPMYSNGPAPITNNYRVAYGEEENLSAFVAAFLNFESPVKFVDGKPAGLTDNAHDFESRFDEEDIKKIAAGDVTPLKNVLKYQPNNNVKVAIGIRTTDDGKQYHVIYNRMFLNNGATKYDRLGRNISSTQSTGAFSNVQFDTEELHEYKVEATPLESTADNNTFDPTSDLPVW